MTRPTTCRQLLRGVVAALCVTSAGAQAEQIIGLTGLNSLVFFDSATPGIVSAPLAVTGLATGDSLLAIDVRPADGQLVGVTQDALTGATAKVYTINTTTGAATLALLGLGAIAFSLRRRRHT